MKKLVKFLKSGIGAGLAYFAGDIAELEEKQADELMEVGFVIPVKAENVSNLPEDIPCRQVLIDNGFTTLEEVAKCLDLTELKGIGDKSAKAITEFIEALKTL